MGEEVPDIDCDTQLELIRDEARRELLLALLPVRRGTDDSVELASLDLDSQRGGHQIDFHHVHLPKLTEHGIVDVTEPGERVAPGVNFDAIQPLLEGIETSCTESLPNDD